MEESPVTSDLRRPIVVVSLSGGMDSATLLAHYYTTRDFDLVAVSADYGQRHRRELDFAAALANNYGAEHIRIDLQPVGKLLSGSALTDPSVEVPEGHYAWETMLATVVPNRNMILASVLIGVAVARQARLVAFGIHSGDHAVYPDCRPEFVEALQRLAAIANDGFHPPTVEAPFVNISKTDIVRRGAELGVPYQLTWSCYKGGEAHCGVCGTCYERREAFRDAGVPDPTIYLDSRTKFAVTEGRPDSSSTLAG
jgi:7-cyano-7-deazaguanine synthase